jgi:hypothetical protein
LFRVGLLATTANSSTLTRGDSLQKSDGEVLGANHVQPVCVASRKMKPVSVDVFGEYSSVGGLALEFYLEQHIARLETEELVDLHGCEARWRG